MSAKHPYLVAKGVRAYGIRQLKDALVIPVRDGEGQLQGLQFIQADGSKRFTTGMAKAGHYHALGKLQGRILIAEGYATAATLHAATGDAVAVAFDAGNLASVARALRAKFPKAEIILAADNDHRTEGNPGLSKARDAADAVSGRVAAPEFSAADTGTDWNDYAAQHGLESVSAALAAALQAAPAPAVQSAPPAEASAPDSKPEAKAHRPRFTVDSDGIWHHGFKDGEALPPYYVGPPLKVS